MNDNEQQNDLNNRAYQMGHRFGFFLYQALSLGFLFGMVALIAYLISRL